MVNRRLQTEAPRTLLVLKPGSFGDIIHTLPAVARLKAAWPGCRISWLVNTEWMPLVSGNPDVDELIEFPRRGFRGWDGGWRAAKWLRATICGRQPDMALDFQGLLRSALIGRACGARTLEGLSDAREGAKCFYHRTVTSLPQPVHAIERYLALANAALSDASGGEPPARSERLSYHLPDGRQPRLPSELGEDFVLIHPFARGNYKSLKINELERLLCEMRTRKIVVVGRGEANIETGGTRCLNLINQTTLPELIWLMRHASFVVSVDSGPAHLAAALDRPLVAIHSWSDPRKVGPYRPDAWVWKNGTLTQMSRLSSLDGDFFAAKPLALQAVDLQAIARLATSPANFSA